MNIYTAFAVHISIIPTLHIPLKRVSLLQKFLSVQLLRSQCSISAVRLFNLGGQGVQFATEYSERKVVQFMKRAVYDKQFKMAAVKLAQETDKSVAQTAAELGISGCSLRRWINEYDEYGESAFPGHGNALFNSTYELKKIAETE